MKLFIPSQIFEKSIYFYDGKSSLTELALKLSTTPQSIVLRNNLREMPPKNYPLIIERFANVKVLDVETLSKLSQEEKTIIMKRNSVDYLFIGQVVAI